ncbi:pyrethroid hydrolase Ces2e-like isoform X2 [Clavelina lepadiformis]|uniref:pyrethroid hydrolase Ces2e-like isoform X2 n=1 Tax=Clavelina lepadiformis TaxID=159417 RepID=UPI0040438F40
MSDCPVVSTKLGKVKGQRLHKPSFGKSQVYHYTNIPFAKPPIGELRFEAPVKPNPWSEVLDGTVNPPSPIQSPNAAIFKLYRTCRASYNQSGYDMTNMSEDCLYLSVYTAQPSEHSNLPVLFWIDGGGYCTFGAASQGTTNGNILCSLHDVIVVVANYRVGVFGFLTTGKDTSYSGNMGFLDQIAALEWTRDNIREFGGDPDNVTIIGQGAGAVSVSYHVISPMSCSLFQKAVSLSGSAIIPEFPRQDTANVFNQLIKELEIEQDEDEDPDEVIRGLKNVPSGRLREVQEKLEESYMYFGPVVDGTFLPKLPSELLVAGEINPVPYVIGCTNSELCGYISMLDPDGFGEGLNEETSRNFIKGYFEIFFSNGVSEKVIDHIIAKYVNDFPKEPTKWSKIYATALADFVFIVPAVTQALSHDRCGLPTYVYQMTQQLSYNHNTAYGSVNQIKPTFCKCDHETQTRAYRYPRCGLAMTPTAKSF